mgnify:CR=1 FL=1
MYLVYLDQPFLYSKRNENKSERDKHLVFLVRESCVRLYKDLDYLDQNFLYND